MIEPKPELIRQLADFIKLAKNHQDVMMEKFSRETIESVSDPADRASRELHAKMLDGCMKSSRGLFLDILRSFVETGKPPNLEDPWG